MSAIISTTQKYPDTDAKYYVFQLSTPKEVIFASPHPKVGNDIIRKCHNVQIVHYPSFLTGL